jgi:hypothetical protein
MAFKPRPAPLRAFNASRPPQADPQATKVRVWPSHPHPGLILHHPIDGALDGVEGSLWTRDQFTAALIQEGSITTEAPKSEGAN